MLIYRSFRPYAFLILAAALLLPLPGCDRGDDVTPPIIIQTPEPIRGVIITAEFSGFFTDTYFGIPIDIEAQQPGILDITVDWTEDETWMYVYFGDTECGHAELSGGTCPFLVASETKDPKPRIPYTDLLSWPSASECRSPLSTSGTRWCCDSVRSKRSCWASQPSCQ